MAEIPYSMPLCMPEYSSPPYRLGPLGGANFLCTLPPEVLASLVPEPLAANPEGMLWIYTVHIAAAKPLPLPYHELGIFVPVVCDGQPGLFALALFLDEPLPITIGREVWGFPKRYADSIVIEREDDRCHSRLAHEGLTLMEARFRVTEKETRPGDEQPARVYTRRVIPSWQAGERSVDQLVALNWVSSNETRFEGEQAEITVAFPAWSQLSVLNKMRCVKSWYSETESCTLDGGEVVRDYLS